LERLEREATPSVELIIPARRKVEGPGEAMNLTCGQQLSQQKCNIVRMAWENEMKASHVRRLNPTIACCYRGCCNKLNERQERQPDGSLMAA